MPAVSVIVRVIRIIRVQNLQTVSVVFKKKIEH